MELKLFTPAGSTWFQFDLREQAKFTARQIVEWLEAHSQNWHPIPCADSLLIVGSTALQELRQAAGMEDK